MDMGFEPVTEPAAAEQNPDVSPRSYTRFLLVHPATERTSPLREKGVYSPIHQTAGIMLALSGPDSLMSAVCQQNANRLLPAWYQLFGE